METEQKAVLCSGVVSTYKPFPLCLPPNSDGQKFLQASQMSFGGTKSPQVENHHLEGRK